MPPTCASVSRPPERAGVRPGCARARSGQATWGVTSAVTHTYDERTEHDYNRGDRTDDENAEHEGARARRSASTADLLLARSIATQ